MNSVQKMIFPGILVGCLFLVLATSWIAVPQIAHAPGPRLVLLDAAIVLPSPTPAPQAAPTALEVVPPTDPPAQTAAAVDAAVQNEAAISSDAAPSSQAAEGCSLSEKYPSVIQQWCGLIDQYAGQNAVDAHLIAAVMLQESGGNEKAYSKSGAVGLMQVMPRDGLAAAFQCGAGPCFAARPSIAELYDPEFNISYGSRMLAGLLKKRGDLREALRAYGPMDMGYRYADIVLRIMQQYR